jgi:hypothetical protein
MVALGLAAEVHEKALTRKLLVRAGVGGGTCKKSYHLLADRAVGLTPADVRTKP